MYNILISLFKLLSKKSRRTFKILIIFLFFTTIFEIVGLAMILPFLILVNNLDLVTTNEFIKTIYNYFNLNSSIDFLFMIGGMAVFFSFIGVILSIYTNLKLTKFSNRIGSEFSIKLFRYFLNKKNISNSEIVNIRKKTITQTVIVSNNIILPLINIIARTILIILLFSILLIVNYKFTIIFTLLFLVIYLIMYRFSSKKVSKNIEKITLLKEEKAKLFSNTFNKIDELSSKDKKDILAEYSNNTITLSDCQSFNNVVSKLPRYIMMFFVFSTVVLVSMYLVSKNQNGIGPIMHLILIYIIAGLKILPQFQNVYINYMKFQSNKNAFFDVEDILNKCQ